MTGARVGSGEGLARRGRERRLRAWCHERASFSAAVVSALHHSCDVGAQKEDKMQNEARRLSSGKDPGADRGKNKKVATGACAAAHHQGFYVIKVVLLVPISVRLVEQLVVVPVSRSGKRSWCFSC